MKTVVSWNRIFGADAYQINVNVLFTHFENYTCVLACSRFREAGFNNKKYLEKV